MGDIISLTRRPVRMGGRAPKRCRWTWEFECADSDRQWLANFLREKELALLADRVGEDWSFQQKQPHHATEATP